MELGRKIWNGKRKQRANRVSIQNSATRIRHSYCWCIAYKYNNEIARIDIELDSP